MVRNGIILETKSAIFNIYTAETIPNDKISSGSCWKDSQWFI